MVNSKRNIHTSGPLGMLMKKGQVKKLGQTNTDESELPKDRGAKGSSYFATQAGVEFSESELAYVDVNECEPWKYANRLDGDMGDIQELIDSIKSDSQLQPALVRTLQEPRGDIKYEIIFGRRRHLACKALNIPFLVIKKNITDLQEAVVSQDAENKFRNDVSPYSNAQLYKRLLDDGLFSSTRALSKKLRIPSSTLNDLMAFNRIPEDLVAQLPNIHGLSRSFAAKIVGLIEKSSQEKDALYLLAPKIGASISSPVKLEGAVNSIVSKNVASRVRKAKKFSMLSGEKAFTLKYDQRGTPTIVFDKQALTNVNLDSICERILEVFNDH